MESKEDKREGGEEGGIFGEGRTTAGGCGVAREWREEDGVTEVLAETIKKLPQGRV